MTNKEVMIGASSVTIQIERGLIRTFLQYCTAQRVVIITDATVHKHYGKCFPEVPCIILAHGEASKSLTTFETIIQQLIAYDIDPSTHLVGIGGGVVCDITGFVASVYMRGLRFSLIPTTILAQADAAIGGKNGINVDEYKNILGTITQPVGIYIDPDFCVTLEEQQRRNGLFEVLKYGCIADVSLFEYCVAHTESLLSGDVEALHYVIERSVELKLTFVTEDERDKGVRRALNFGHTFGHALELRYSMLHGYAVGCGMVIAAAMSHVLGLLSYEEYCRIRDLLMHFGVPDIPTSCSSLVESIRKDKKRNDSDITLVLLDAIGSYTLVTVSFSTFEEQCVLTDAFLCAEKVSTGFGAKK